MLRRRLLCILAPLVALLAGTAVAAVWSLQRVLDELNHINTEAWQVVEDANQFSTEVNEIETELHRLARGEERHLDRLILAVNAARRLAGTMEESYILRDPGIAPVFDSIRQRLPQFEQHVGSLATTEDPDIRVERTRQFLSAAVRLRQDTLPLSRYVRAHARAEQDVLLSGFRRVVLTLSLMFLIVINVSVMILMRMAGMILRPMDKLIDATRRLGAGEFGYRVEMPQRDEFGQLASAYNDLAQALSENEQRKMEVLLQAARTLSHELNNCASIIELQLSLLSRQPGQRPEMAERLKEIRGGLERMTRTVAALLHVRRIVLTDYTPGIKMLDLEKSVRAEEPTASV